MFALRHEKEIYGQELLEKITSFSIPESDLMKEFEISEATLRQYRKKDKAPERASSVQMKLVVLEHALELIHTLGFQGKEYEMLKGLTYEGDSILQFINKFASNELAEKFIVTLIEKELAGTTSKRAIEVFRDKYGHLNDENLLKASAEQPALLIKMVVDTDLRPSTRGDILQAIAHGARPEFFEFTREQLKSESPFLREAALLSLFGYYQSDKKYAYLKAEFLKRLEVEKAEGVRQTLKELIEEM